jgi:hypothetical protein
MLFTWFSTLAAGQLLPRTLLTQVNIPLPQKKSQQFTEYIGHGFPRSGTNFISAF